MIIPFERSYWVLPGKFLAGEIPSSKAHDIRQQKVKNILEMNFDVIINLMEMGEETFSGDKITEYEEELKSEAERHNKIIKVLRFPIKDLSVTTEENMEKIINLINRLIFEGKKVYVHCWGGIGRTGSVVGCYLLEYGHAEKENVIETINYLKRTTSISDRKSPETDEQHNFILNWLNRNT